MLVAVDAPHFYAGIEVHHGKVINAAPILSWAMGSDWGFLQSYFKKKGWKYYV